MAVYPAAVTSIPDDGTWTHAQVGDEIDAVTAELGVTPSGAQATVAARFGVVEDRVTVVENAAADAGIEVASAQLTAPYDIRLQTSNTTFTDIGLSIAVGAQTRAYNVTFHATALVSTNSSFAAPKFSQVMARIVDSTVAEALQASTFPFVMAIAGAVNYTVMVAITGRVPAGRAATTWKVQARIAPAAPDANVSQVIFQGGTPLSAPVTGVGNLPMQLQAITV